MKKKLIFITARYGKTSAQGIRYSHFIKGFIKGFNFFDLNFKNNLLARIINKTIGKKIFPDSYAIYLLYYKYILRRVFKEQEKYDYCIIGVTPFSMLSLSKYIKKVSPNTKIIVDFSDPFSFNAGLLENKKKQQKAEKIERKYFPYIDKMIFLNHKIKQEYQQKYPFLKNRLFVIEQGVNEYFIDSINNSKISPKVEEINFLYAGGFYKKFRNPSILYKAFHAIDQDIKLDIFGNIRKELRPFVSNRLYCNKAINRDKLIEQFKKADAIVLFDNKIGLQVPGKTIECLALKKPILLINDNPKSPTLDYIIGLDNVYLTNNIQKNIQSAIMDIADDLKENRKYEIPLDYSEFLWDKLINNYVNIIKGDLNKMRSSCLPIFDL